MDRKVLLEQIYYFALLGIGIEKPHARAFLMKQQLMEQWAISVFHS